MHVVSDYLYNGNIIWLPWQRPVTIQEWGTESSSAHKVPYGEKIAKIGPVYPEIFDKICWTTWTATQFPSVSLFSAETTGPIFTKILQVIIINQQALKKPLTLIMNKYSISANADGLRDAA